MKKKTILGKTLTYVKEDLSDQGVAGYFDPDAAIISLHKDLRGDQLKYIQLHEEFHAVWDRLGLNRTSVPDDLQEVIVDGFALFMVEHYKLREK